MLPPVSPSWSREICPDSDIYAFATVVEPLATRRGFALRDVIDEADVGHGTNVAWAVTYAMMWEDYDRIVVVTDEQTWGDDLDGGCIPEHHNGYVINVAPYCNGLDRGRLDADRRIQRGGHRLDDRGRITLTYLEKYHDIHHINS